MIGRHALVAEELRSIRRWDRRYLSSTAPTEAGTEDADASPADPETRRAELDALRREAEATSEFDALIVGYAELGDPSAAEDVLIEMERLATIERDGNDIDAPDVDSYTAVLDAWVERQVGLLEDLRGGNDTKGGDIDGEAATCEEIRVRMVEAAERADGVLRKMEEVSSLAASGENDDASSSSSSPLAAASVSPTSHHYDAVISAWSRACSEGGGGIVARGAPQRAQHVLDRMEKLGLLGDAQQTPLRGGGTGVKPTVATYNAVLQAWAESDDLRAAPRAQEVYRRFKEGGTANVLGIESDAETARIMIRAWADSSQKAAAFNATRHLMRMAQLLEAGVEDMEPTLEDWQRVLRAWAEADPKKNKNAAVRSLTVLRRLETLYMNRVTDARPDADFFRLVLESLSRTRLEGMGPKASDLLRKMDEEYHLVPETGCYEAAVRTWSESAVRRGKDSDGDGGADGGGGGGSREADGDAHEADAILDRMAEAYHRTATVVVRTTTRAYDDVIRAWSASSRRGAAERAEERLAEMEERWRLPLSGEEEEDDDARGKEGDDDEAERVRPTAESYAHAIRAWANSPRPDKVERAMDVLKRAGDEFRGGRNDMARPTLEMYHAAVSACANVRRGDSADGKGRALRSAVGIVQTMKKESGSGGGGLLLSANSETYRLLLECCSRLLPKESAERERAAKSVFESCCTEGMVDGEVLGAFREAAPYELYKTTILARRDSGGDPAEGRTLPDEWTRNAKVRLPGARMAPPLSVDGVFLRTNSMMEHRMRKLRLKTNQKLLRGGRMNWKKELQKKTTT